MGLIYLAGPIYGEGEDAERWRRQAALMISAAGHEAVDPLARDYRGLEGVVDPAAIVRPDLADIARCGAVLARVAAPSWGTAMELAYARMMGVPVHGWGAVNRSPWLVYHTASLAPSLELGVAAAIKEVTK